jgi:hypothetical protein
VDFRRTRERITLVDGLRHFVALEQFAKTAAETLGGGIERELPTKTRPTRTQRSERAALCPSTTARPVSNMRLA